MMSQPPPAGPSAPPPPPSPSPTVSYGNPRRRVGFAIIGISAVIFGILYLLPKLTGEPQRQAVDNPHLGQMTTGSAYPAPMPQNIAAPATLPGKAVEQVTRQTQGGDRRQSQPEDPVLSAQIPGFNTHDVKTAAVSPDAPETDRHTDDAFSAALRPSNIGRPAVATRMRHPLYTIPKGKVIPCLLDTAINSQLVGGVTCHMTDDYWGMQHALRLLPRDSVITGEIKSHLEQGQNRVFVLWTTITTPGGIELEIDSPGTDQLGAAGQPGEVNYHFWERFGPALFLSVIDFIPSIAQSALQSRGNNNVNTSILSQPSQQLANTALEAQINIPPTLEARPGRYAALWVARDLDFYPVYKLNLVNDNPTCLTATHC